VTERSFSYWLVEDTSATDEGLRFGVREVWFEDDRPVSFGRAICQNSTAEGSLMHLGFIVKGARRGEALRTDVSKYPDRPS